MKTLLTYLILNMVLRDASASKKLTAGIEETAGMSRNCYSERLEWDWEALQLDRAVSENSSASWTKKDHSVQFSYLGTNESQWI